MVYEVAIFLAGAGAKAVIDVVVKRVSAAIGPLHYIRKDCGFFVTVQLEDGRTVETVTREPEIAAPSSDTVTLKIRGELLNDSDATRILLAPQIIFVHTSGRHEIYVNPTFHAGGKEAASVSLAPRSTTDVAISAELPKSSLQDYAQMLPLLEFPLPGGKKRLRYRAAGVSFYGEPRAFWPKDGDTPVLYGSGGLSAPSKDSTAS